MSRRPAAILALLLIGTPALAQKETVYTQPTIPSPRDLDRLNLTMAWKVYMPVESRADGIATVQMIENQIFVQTRSNTLIVLRASSGEEEWRITLPKRYLPVQPVAVNAFLVLVVNGPQLYLLDRVNGKIKYDVELPSTVAAGLTADIQQCFIVLSSNRIISVGLQPEDVRIGQRVRPRIEEPDPPAGVRLETQPTGELSTTNNRSPSVNMLQTLRPPFIIPGKDVSPSVSLLPTLRKPYQMETGNRSPSAQMVSNMTQLAELSEIGRPDKPRILWELQANRRVEEQPLIYGDFLIFSGTDRSTFVTDKHADKQNRVRHAWFADADLAAPLGQYGADLYASVSDGNVYWIGVESFRNVDVTVKPLKRFLAGNPVDRKPLTTDDSVYLASTQSGLIRLERRTFEKSWSNPDAVRVYAANPHVVYAGDKRGNLLILDKARGLKLATLDIKGFNLPVVNELDDRLYLAAHNGLLVCLHDRTYRRPELLRKKEPKPVLEEPKVEEPKKEPPKKEEPKKEPPKKEEPKKEPPKKEEPKKEPEKKP